MRKATILEEMAKDTELVWVILTAGVSEMRRKSVINQEAAVNMMRYIASLKGCPDFIKDAADNCENWIT